jgi:hypothetical protein
MPAKRAVSKCGIKQEFWVNCGFWSRERERDVGLCVAGLLPLELEMLGISFNNCIILSEHVRKYSKL